MGATIRGRERARVVCARCARAHAGHAQWRRSADLAERRLVQTPQGKSGRAECCYALRHTAAGARVRSPQA